MTSARQVFVRTARGDAAVCPCGRGVDVELDPEPDALGLTSITITPVTGGAVVDGIALCATCAQGEAA